MFIQKMLKQHYQHLRSYEDYDTKEFESLNLSFEADNQSEAITALDAGPFVRNSSDL
jgi:hypothetical protein